MSNLYTATANLHKAVQEKAEKLGLEIELLNDSYYKIIKHRVFNKFELESVFKIEGEIETLITGQDNIINVLSKKEIPLIEEKQIRQILLAFQEVLGENPEFIKTDLQLGKDKYDFEDMIKTYNKGFDAGLHQTKTQVKALDDNWLSTIEENGKYTGQCMFDREPVKVLEELTTIINNI
jgi:hypothetical protein